MYPDHKGLVWAALQLAGGKNKNGGNRINNKVYGWLKRKNSKRVSKQNKERWKHAEFRDTITRKSGKRFKKMWKNTEFRDKMVEKSKEQWQCPEYRATMVKAVKQYWSDPKNKESASKRRTGKQNGSYGRYWYHNPETHESIKCLPEEVPEGFRKGRTKKEAPDNTKCKICNTDTGGIFAQYCKYHRKKRQKNRIKQSMKNVDLGSYRPKASDDDIKKALTETEFNVSLAMKSLGYTTDGGSARQRFQKVLNSIRDNAA